MLRSGRFALTSLLALGACQGESVAVDGGPDAPSEDAPSSDTGMDAAERHDGFGASEDAGFDSSVDVSIDAPPLAEPWLVEVTTEWGIDHVRDSVDDYQTLTDRVGGGVCPIDADGIAPIDLVFAMRPTAASHTRLYVASQPGGPGTDVHYADETEARGLGAAGDVFACLAFDADADGDEDLALSGPHTVQLFLREGASFVDASASLGLSLDPSDVYASISAGDVDHDGDVDLHVGGFIHFDTSRYIPGQRCGVIPCVSSLYEFEGIANLLLLRDADGTYREVAATLAPDLARAEMTFVTGILRMTGRGPVDLWVGNDLGGTYRDRVLRWDEASAAYGDVGFELGLATNGRGYGVDTMGWSQGDLDGNGELDFVATSWPGDTTAVYFCGPLPEGGELCEDRGRTVGLERGVGRFRWGVGLGDLDLDGDLDLVEATGHLYSQADLRASGVELQAASLYENLGHGVLFLQTFPEGDALDLRSTQRGLSLVDLDDDGRLDVVMASAHGAPRVLRNVRPTSGHYLRLVLAGQGAGARVEVRWDAGRLVRAHPIGEGFMGNFDPRVHVGLPAEVSHVDVDVSWPSGRTSHEAGVAVDRELTITEP
ncbi:MAG: FG-GAP-like repeat-containing protein [Sandaracinus sp.]